MTLINMDALRESAPRLHKVVLKHVGGEGSGERDIDLMALPQFNRGELFGWVSEYNGAVPDIAAAAVRPPEPQINMAQLAQEEEAAMQKAADAAAGRNRLEAYAREGLEDTQANALAIREWLDANVKGYLSETGVNAAVANLGPRGANKLTWRKPQAPAAPPSPEPEPQEVLESWQLPIDASERMMKASTTKALQDLIKRRRAATNQQIIRGRAGEQRQGSAF